MATCKSCGAEIQFVETPEGRIPLERFTEPTGDRRYRITSFSPLEGERVSAQSNIDAYPDHRKDCPAFDNGLLSD